MDMGEILFFSVHLAGLIGWLGARSATRITEELFWESAGGNCDQAMQRIRAKAATRKAAGARRRMFSNDDPEEGVPGLDAQQTALIVKRRMSIW
jgi:hypothetical protein